MRNRLLARIAAGLMLAGSAAFVASGVTGGPASAPRLSLARSVLPASCPAAAPSRISADSWALTRQELAPPGASAIRFCRYSGLNDQPRLALVRSILRTDSHLVAELVKDFDRLPAAQGTFACPSDDGAEIVSLLAYPDGHTVSVSLALAGCQTVTNGSVHRTAAGIGSPPAYGPQLVARLKRLTAPPIASTGMRPPAPRVSTLGVTRSATLDSYCWMQPLPGGAQHGMCADGSPGHPDHTLQWHPRAAVIIDLRLPADDVQIQAAWITGFGKPARHILSIRARRIARTGRRWSIRLPVRARRDNELLISARFANGDLAAELGLQRSR